MTRMRATFRTSSRQPVTLASYLWMQTPCFRYEGGGEEGGRRESEGREDGKGRNREGTEGARERPMGGGGKQRSVEGRE